jgi:hypothetical protein
MEWNANITQAAIDEADEARNGCQAQDNFIEILKNLLDSPEALPCGHASIVQLALFIGTSSSDIELVRLAVAKGASTHLSITDGQRSIVYMLGLPVPGFENPSWWRRD